MLLPQDATGVSGQGQSGAKQQQQMEHQLPENHEQKLQQPASQLQDQQRRTRSQVRKHGQELLTLLRAASSWGDL